MQEKRKDVILSTILKGSLVDLENEKINALDIMGENYVALDSVKRIIDRIKTEMECEKCVEEETKEIYIVNTNGLNFRDDRMGNIIGVLSNGDEVIKLGEHLEDPIWFKIEYKGIVGYVSSRFLDKKIEKSQKLYQLRRFNSDVFVYETGPDEDVTVSLGQFGRFETLNKIDKKGFDIISKINCGFFGGGREHLGTYVVDGLYYFDPDSTFIDFIYYKDGTSEVKFIPNLQEVAKLQKSSVFAIGTSWALRINGQNSLLNAEKISHSAHRHPRTLLGHKKDGGFIFVVVDGRSTTSSGITAQESMLIMEELGAWNAVNLDGGGSTQMIVNNKIVNNPSEPDRRIGSAMIAYKK